MDSTMSPRRAFYGVAALIVAASAAATVAWCASMPATGGMPMHGDSMHSMTGMHRSGAMWLGMWVVMTPAMMLPSLAPALWHYREAVGRSGAMRPGRSTAVAGVGYLAVWTLAGVGVLPAARVVSESLGVWPELARIAPIAVGVAVMAMGAIQFTAWKARQLGHCRCRSVLGGAYRARARSAWRHGMRLGVDCLRCCANLMTILLVAGVMDLRAMAVVTAAITLERLAPAGARIARMSGALAFGAGMLQIARALG